MVLNQPIRQIAYCVDDLHAAARRHSALFGSGPFLTVELPPLDVTYRGQKHPLEVAIALGQWGAMQVELIQLVSTAPSLISELYPSGGNKAVLHHVAMFVDDLEDAVARMAKDGMPEVSRLGPVGGGFEAVFVDGLQKYGHFIEIYEPAQMLLDMYDVVAKAAVGFNGENPVRAMA